MFENKQVRSKEAWLYPVHPSTHLLSQPSHKKLLDSIKEIVISNSKSKQDTDQESEMIEQHYDICYEELLHRYAQFVQSLSEPGISHDESMLNRSLARLYSVLTMVGGQLPQIAEARPMMGGVEKIFFAVFSASLLYEVGRVCENRVVHLCNATGEYIDLWDPLVGPVEGYTHYKVRYSQNWRKDLMKPLTICYARSIMPKVGMLWLADSAETMQWWFKLLTDLQAGFTELDVTFDMEECLRHMSQLTFEALDQDKTIPKETVVGEAFWVWLQEQLAKGGNNINSHGALAHVTEEGILLDYDVVFDEFLNSQSQYNDKVVLVTQFNYLGLAAKSGGDLKVKKYFGTFDDGKARATSTLFGHAHSNENKGTQSTINAVVISKSCVEGAYQFVHSESMRPSSQSSWVNQFFSRFLGMMNVSGLDHTQQP